MKRLWIAARLGSLTLVLVAGMLAAGPALAKKSDNHDEPKEKDPGAWSDPVVMGTVTDVFWAEAREQGQHTATMKVWSNENDLAVTVYGDDPTVRRALMDGTVCVGRYVEVGGDRLERDTMIGRGINFSDTATACTATIGPEPAS
jgi:hypothetical protein